MAKFIVLGFFFSGSSGLNVDRRILTLFHPVQTISVLKDEPDDLTHLAPTAGDACIPLMKPHRSSPTCSTTSSSLITTMNCWQTSSIRWTALAVNQHRAAPTMIRLSIIVMTQITSATLLRCSRPACRRYVIAKDQRGFNERWSAHASSELT